ncbi:MAG: ATP synthase F1 subunit delta [Candidatus Eremiobacteraeota bacterium]|nr:ATP synthase F1 subunit delta [Candidatus Eremiobacteraeota bacterium]
MGNETVARRYAVAIFGLAQEQNAIDQVGKDLHTIHDAIASDETTRRFFLAPVIDRPEKSQVIVAAFNGKAHAVALHTLLLLIRKRREALLEEIVAQYDKLEVAARGNEPMTVTTAHVLSPPELQSMVERLERVYGKKFDVTTCVDPHLIGGVRITMADRRIDGTVAGRLDELSRSLFANN